MTGRETHFCGGCQRPVVAIRPHWVWSVAVVGAFAFFILLTALVGAGGLLILGGGVVVFVLGTCVIGPLAGDPRRRTAGGPALPANPANGQSNKVDRRREPRPARGRRPAASRRA